MVAKFCYEKYSCGVEKQLAFAVCFIRAIIKSVLSKMNNYRKIQASSKAKNARYSARRDPKIMDIESTTCGIQVPHPYG